MKLKSLKFVLPILLVLPSLAFARINYWRTPTGTEITSPVTIHVDFDDWNSDICWNIDYCIQNAIYWQFKLYSLSDSSTGTIYYGRVYDKTTKEATESFDLPVGTKIFIVGIQAFREGQGYDQGYIIEIRFSDRTSPPNYVFEIIGTSTPPSSPPSGTIGNTQNWLSSNEILAYIGKLAEDIPNYIALMMGLPISFWFIEKTIAFVRGNFSRQKR
jgi:hypothetical protein